MSTFLDTHVRQADYLDPYTESLVWIGSECAVEVPSSMIDEIAKYAHMAGQHARDGYPPEAFGITVDTYGVEYLAPMFRNGIIPTRQRDVGFHHDMSLWDAFRSTLGYESCHMIAVDLDADMPAKPFIRDRRLRDDIERVNRAFAS